MKPRIFLGAAAVLLLFPADRIPPRADGPRERIAGRTRAPAEIPRELYLRFPPGAGLRMPTRLLDILRHSVQFDSPLVSDLNREFAKCLPRWEKEYARAWGPESQRNDETFWKLLGGRRLTILERQNLTVEQTAKLLKLAETDPALRRALGFDAPSPSGSYLRTTRYQGHASQFRLEALNADTRTFAEAESLMRAVLTQVHAEHGSYERQTLDQRLIAEREYILRGGTYFAYSDPRGEASDFEMAFRFLEGNANDGWASPGYERDLPLGEPQPIEIEREYDLDLPGRVAGVRVSEIGRLGLRKGGLVKNESRPRLENLFHVLTNMLWNQARGKPDGEIYVQANEEVTRWFMARYGIDDGNLYAGRRLGRASREHGWRVIFTPEQLRNRRKAPATEPWKAAYILGISYADFIAADSARAPESEESP